MGAAIVSDDAVTVLAEEEHLGVPGVGVEGPAVREDDGLAGAPVFVEERGGIFECEVGHGGLLLLRVGARWWIPGQLQIEVRFHCSAVEGVVHASKEVRAMNFRISEESGFFCKGVPQDKKATPGQGQEQR